MKFRMVENFIITDYNNENELEEKLILDESNQITSQLPPALDQFLMDMAQMYCDFDYTDITNFANRATQDDIRKVNNIRRSLNRRFDSGYEETDPSVIELFNKLTELIKNNNNSVKVEESIISEVKSLGSKSK